MELREVLIEISRLHRLNNAQAELVHGMLILEYIGNGVVLLFCGNSVVTAALSNLYQPLECSFSRSAATTRAVVLIDYINNTIGTGLPVRFASLY